MITTRSPIPNIKQQSPLITHKPDHLFPTSTSDRPSPLHKPDRLFPTSTSDCLSLKQIA
ncbi:MULTISPECIES: hypothetical protein [Pseudanabaena]|uniref:Uncharacterized protein n=2 Tax=Pseudanabaena TaxID=1152 RepID=L8N039_9CYAN|nr:MULTISPECIES: hypothetical protein [Pseudanabaena]ELS32389.1 hypothetical protein Pse7429DRAFT_2293 [Pseudanabaena biceps PCC 7429]MDG3495380.1 hypothetical protein [Pseudanabaena catenata USMAC16]